MQLTQVNPKRIYRMMKQNQLLFKRAEPLKNDRMHYGQVTVSNSNSHWCPDRFEIKCWNGEKVRVIFGLDALLMALWRRRPNEPVIIHLNQGSQYSSGNWHKFCQKHNLIPIMSLALRSILE